MNSMQQVFEHTLRDVYYAENALIKALPKIEAAASSAELRSAVKQHLAETKEQIKLLDKVFKSIDVKPTGEECAAIEGLIEEASTVIAEARAGQVRDAALIGCCQAVEHYEIARYGTLREWAKSLDLIDAHGLLSQILDQEKAANSALTHLAVHKINASDK